MRGWEDRAIDQAVQRELKQLNHEWRNHGRLMLLIGFVLGVIVTLLTSL